MKRRTQTEKKVRHRVGEIYTERVRGHPFGTMKWTAASWHEETLTFYHYCTGFD